MTPVTVMRRRDFLKTGALATAGLLLGFRVGEGAAGAPNRRAPFEPNAWLCVDPNGAVTVWIARSEMGQGVRTVLPMLVAEELEADWRTVRFEQAEPGPRHGDMSTGGSRSVRSLFVPLREAGASAREMLVAAAAATWRVEPRSCRAHQGKVVHAESGRELGFGALAAKAARQPVPKNVKLKEPGQWTLLGRSPGRLDSPAKVDGSAVFGIDMRMDGLLTACVARCPVYGGKLASHDGARALASPGVRRVVPIGSGVAVVADTYWAARRGLEALEITWDEGALATLDSAGISKTFAAALRQPGAVVRREGEGDAALARAAKTLEAAYETPYLAHATMEPMNCTAAVSVDRCDVWVGTQAPNVAQRVAAAVTGLPPEKVHVHLQYLGGGFGRRAEWDFVEEAVELSKAVRAPVKVVWSREDDMRHDFYRPATAHLLRAGLDAGGQPLAWTHRLVGPGILQRLAPAAIHDGVDPSSTDGAENMPYGFAHVQVESALSHPGVPVGWWRSVSASQNAYAVECFIDEIAAAAGQDPVALRRSLLARQPQHLAVLEAAARASGWGTPLPPRQGRGIAVVESFDSYVAHVAEVEVLADGQVRVRRVVCAIDCGTVMDPDLVVSQMESGIVFGLSAVLHGEVPIAKGRAAISNFDGYPVVTMAECPKIEVRLVPSGTKLGGIGEVGVPPIAPAVVNAIAAATGVRVRRLPVRKEDLRQG